MVAIGSVVLVGERLSQPVWIGVAVMSCAIFSGALILHERVSWVRALAVVAIAGSVWIIGI